MSTKKIVIIFSGLAAVILIVAVLIFYYKNNPLETSSVPKCTFYTLTGYKCPGCGGQRALHYFLRGKFKESFMQNPLLYFAVTYIIILILIGKRYSFLYGEIACAIWLIIIIGFSVLRNIL